MTPTPAQIEAATEAIQKLAEELNPPSTFPISKKRSHVYATAALTAAAEVGVKRQNNMEWLQSKVDALDGDNATIERCIEAAEWFRNIERYSLDDVIARIRALKEKP